MREPNSSNSHTQHPEDKGVCSYDVFLRTLGGTAYVINPRCSSCSTCNQPTTPIAAIAPSQRPKNQHQLQHRHGAHHDGNSPTEEDMRAVRMDRILRPQRTAQHQAEKTRLKRPLPRRLSANTRKSRISPPRKTLSMKRSPFVR